jgi:protein involved in polysaccharide export with SLBB domain
LAQYDAVGQSTAYSDVLRQEGRAQAEVIRERLRVGDFLAGDQIALFIEAEGAPQWDTLTVEPGPLIDVPTMGPILLQGVLRSELEARLGTEIGRFIRSPRVQARALIRVSLMGVGRPGFYMMPSDLLLSEAVMLAGGPGAADPDQLRIERGQDVLWSAEELRAPVVDGSTLDDLGLQAGDRIILPAAAGPGVIQSAVAQQLTRSVVFIALPVLLAALIN